MKRSTALTIALILTLSLAACSSDTESGKVTVTETAMAEDTINYKTTERAANYEGTTAETAKEPIISTGMTDLYKNVFLNLTNGINRMTFEQASLIAENAKEQGYTYDKVDPSGDDFGRINIYASDGDYIYILTYPDDSNIETLSIISYCHGDNYQITITDNLHLNRTEYKIFSVDNEPRNTTVDSLSECEEFMFGCNSETN